MLLFLVFMGAWYGLEAESTREDNKIQDDLRLFLVVEDQETNIICSYILIVHVFLSMS